LVSLKDPDTKGSRFDPSLNVLLLLFFLVLDRYRIRNRHVGRWGKPLFCEATFDVTTGYNKFANGDGSRKVENVFHRITVD
jgi:hypothetical protein